MRPRELAGLGLAAPLALVAIAATAAPPPLRHAEFSQVPPAGGLRATVDRLAAAAREPAWVAWEVARVESAGGPCCSWEDDEYCRLEGRDHGWTTDGGTRPPAAGGLIVLARLRGGRAESVRAFAADCPLDAGGLPWIWLGEIDPAESVAWLATLVPRSRDLADRALAALAFHDAPQANATLARLASGDGFERLLLGAPPP